jgi:hypothetical protein
MYLIKYRDEMNGERDYSYFWVHDFKDGKGEVVVSDIFASEKAAIDWATKAKEAYKAQKALNVAPENNL